MKQKIRNYTKYRIELLSYFEKEVLLYTDSLQVAAIKLREYAFKYEKFLREQRELNNSAWLVLYVTNNVEAEPKAKVICRIGSVEGMEELCMI